MKRIVLVAGCLWSLSSWAQAFALSLASDTAQDTYFVNANGCADTIQLMWRYLRPIAGTPTDSFALWATDSNSCGDGPGPADRPLTTVSWLLVHSTRQGTFEVPLPDLAMFDGGTCPTTSLASQTTICGSMPYVLGTIGGSTQYATASPFSILYDAEPPPPPMITLATAHDHGVELEFASSFDTTTVLIEVLAPGASDFQRVVSSVDGNTRVSTSELLNGIEYRVRLVAVDAAGNESAPSSEVTIMPVSSGADAGVSDDEQKHGCSSAPVLFVALSALWFSRRGPRSSCATRSRD